MNVSVEMLAEQAKHMPEALLQEVLDFMGYLRVKHNLPPLSAWDEQISEDLASGAFDAAFDSLAEEAIKEHKAGLTTRL